MSSDDFGVVAFLKKVDLFSLLNDEEIENLMPFMTENEFAPSEIIFREGDAGDTLYVIAQGTAAVSIKLPDGSSKEIALFSCGDFFGEMSLFDCGKRSASCRAVSAAKMHMLNGKSFLGFLRAHPQIAIKIMYKMLNASTHRLQSSNSFLSGMIQWGENARKRAITDELTGVYNRRFLDDAIAEQLNRARESKSECSLVMVDLDHFGAINRMYGQETGDRIILDVVSVFRSCLRQRDIICRYGGDEFSLIFPGTGASAGYALADEVRKRVAALETLKGAGKEIENLSLSMGIASYPADAQNGEALKKRADEALYAAKENGRNQVGRL